VGGLDSECIQQAHRIIGHIPKRIGCPNLTARESPQQDGDRTRLSKAIQMTGLSDIPVVVDDDTEAVRLQFFEESRWPDHPLLPNAHMQQERHPLPLDVVRDLDSIGLNHRHESF
jgi:hypothetical protein